MQNYINGTTIDLLYSLTFRDVFILEEADSGSVSYNYYTFDTLKERAGCWIRMAENGGKEVPCSKYVS